MFTQAGFAAAFEYWPMFLEGVLCTVLLSAFAVFFGFILALILALCRMCKFAPLRWLATAYVEIFRATPMLVQVLLIYNVFTLAFELPTFLVFGLFRFNRFLPGIVALSLNSGAYMSEVIRLGISSIPIGLTEAARSLGLTFTQIIRRVVIPQALRTTVLPMTNLLIAVMLTTALGSQVPLNPQELTGVVSYVNTRATGGVLAFLVSALCYVGTAFVISLVGNRIDRKVRILR